MKNLKQFLKFLNRWLPPHSENLSPYRIRFSPGASEVYDGIEDGLLLRKIRKALGYLQTNVNRNRLVPNPLSKKALKDQRIEIRKCNKLEGPYGSQVYELYMEQSPSDFYLYWYCYHDREEIIILHIKLCI